MAKRIEAPKTETGPRFVRPQASAAEEMTPDLGGSKRGQELPPLGYPEPAFYFAIHPSRWCVMGGEVIPGARHIKLRPGQGGIDADAAGRPKPSTALAEAEEQGWTVLPWDVAGKGTSYLRRVTSTGGWTTKWATLHPGTEEISVDEEGYAGFWRQLIDDGRIDGPAPWVLDKLAGDIRSDLESEIKFAPAGHETGRMKQLRAKLEAVEVARRASARGQSETAEDVPDVA